MRSIALILLAAIVEAKHGAHDALEAIHQRHRHERDLARNETVERRGGSCVFPSDAGLVAVTPGSGNGGWAFAPDQTCTYGRYCPYACPAGQVSMQWDPSATSYTYPLSMNGGLLCGTDGKVSKPFPDRPYCQSTATNIGVTNSAGQSVSFCQTVLPGDEDMLIPTVINSWSAIAVPDHNYWASTAAHYYINPPGTGAEGCIWGSNTKPVGNWAPYVAGANSDSTGETFIKLGWNPIYLEAATPFRNDMPTWGVKIECPNGGCNGLPCAIDPSQNGVNEMVGSASNGAGGGAFCVVTVAKGATANFVVFTPSKAGQFYQSSAVASSPSTSTCSSSSSVSSPSSSSTSIVQTTTSIVETSSMAHTTTSASSAAHTSTTTASQKPSSASGSRSGSASSSASIPVSASTSTTYISSVTGSTTSYSKSPSQQPYYMLINSTASSAVAMGSASNSPIAVASSTILATHNTSGASKVGIPFGSIAVVLVMLL